MSTIYLVALNATPLRLVILALCLHGSRAPLSFILSLAIDLRQFSLRVGEKSAQRFGIVRVRRLSQQTPASLDRQAQVVYSILHGFKSLTRMPIGE
jgi:hypothetical protein